MSVLIKGMEMPKSCEKCPFCIVNRHDRGDDSLCRLINKEVFTFMRSLPQDCPLVPVPPHGRLIDADALPRFGGRKGLIHSADVDNAPTIIEAEGGE